MKSIFRIPRVPSAIKIAVWLSITPALLLGAYLGLLQLTGNVHAVQAGIVYRSAQLDQDDFESIIKSRKIRSILNLRGEDANERWYRSEMAAVQATGVRHFDYGIGSTSYVDAKQVKEILAILRSAPKPLLIHCASGADRTGLVAALYLAEIEGKPVEEAAQQLSILYGHFPYLGSRTVAMDNSFYDFVAKYRPGGKSKVAVEP